MRCEDVQLELQSFFRRELSSESSVAVSAHLETCPTCAREATSMRSLGEFISRGLKEWVNEGVCPPELSARLEVGLRVPSRRLWWRGWAVPVGVVAAAAAFVLALSVRPELGDQVASVPLLGALAAQLNPPDFQVQLDALNARDQIAARPGSLRSIGRSVRVRGITLTLDQAEFSEAGTRLRYSILGLEMSPEADGRLFQPRLLTADGPVPLHNFTGDRRTNSLVFEAYFDAVPVGSSLTLELVDLPVPVREAQSWVLDRERPPGGSDLPVVVADWQQGAAGIEVSLQWPAEALSRLGGWAAIGSGGAALAVTEVERRTIGTTVTQRLHISAPESSGTVTLNSGWAERQVHGPWQVEFGR